MSVQSAVWPKVKEMMRRGVVSVHQESTVDKAVGAMVANDFGSVVVLDALGPTGVLTERDVLAKVSAKGKDPATTVITEVASPSFPAIDSSATMGLAAATMTEKRSRLLVLEDGDVAGILTTSDLVRALGAIAEDFPIDGVISRRLVSALPETPVELVVRTMEEARVGSVLVGPEGKPDRIFTERDLIARVVSRKLRSDSAVGPVSSGPVVTMSRGSTGREVAKVMASKRIKRMPLEIAGALVGIVTARDIVEAFATSRKLTRPKVDWVQWN